jgi:hypothetical protein
MANNAGTSTQTPQQWARSIRQQTSSPRIQRRIASHKAVATAAELAARLRDNDNPAAPSFRSPTHRCDKFMVACGHPSHRFN